MKRDKNPLQFLDSQHNIWTIQPMMKGSWRTLSFNEKKKIVQDLFKRESNLDSYKVTEIRKLKLDFYDDATLYEAKVILENDKYGIIDFVKRGNKITIVDGTTPIITLNKTALPKLDNEDRAEAYLRFFVGALQAEDGRFVLVEQSADINWRGNVPEYKRNDILAKVQPLVLEKTINGGWQATGTVQYYNILFNASFCLYRDGMVEMAQDSPIADSVAILIDYFSDSGVRIKLTREKLLAEKLKENPNDSASLEELKKIPNNYYKEGKWTGAVEAQKLLVKFYEKNNTKFQNDLLNGYLGLAWYQLFAGEFEGSLKSSKNGIKLESNYLPLYTNYAHALLFSGEDCGSRNNLFEIY